jgi:predicted PurR-regulated permease PerM
LTHLDKLSKMAIVVTGLIAVFAALYQLEPIAAPATLALVIGAVLSPLSDFRESRGYSPVVGALVGLVVTLAVLAALTLVFQPVVAQLIEQAPKVRSDLREAVKSIQGLLHGLSEISDEVQKAAAPEAQAATASAPPPEPIDIPTFTDAVLAAPAILAQILIFSGVLFFFLLTRRDIYDWISRHLSGRGERLHLDRSLREAERCVSRYFLTISLVNGGLGATTAVYLQVLGMPGAVVWGVLATLLNFIPYLGPAMFIIALFFAGVAVFDGGFSLLPALGFLVLNAIEGQFVTPTLIGRNLQVNALLVFLSLVFGVWLWGPIGGIVAIPLLLWVMVLGAGFARPKHEMPQTQHPAVE